MKKYDIIVIGTGGGTKLRPASELGYKVAMIEKGKLGGTCLNRGCIPSKMLIYPAHVATHTKDAKKINLNTQFKGADFSKLISRINRDINSDSNAIEEYYKTTKKFDFYKGEAKFISDKIVEVNGKKLTAKYIFIAVGARPRIPPIPGLEGTPYMTSTEALTNKKLPKKLLVIGGGYIACEIGYAYSALGSSVEFIVRSGLLGREDSDIQKEFAKVFTKQQKVHLGHSTQKVEYKNTTFTLTLKDKKGKTKKLKGDALLVATGVIPNNDKLNLQNTKIKLNKRGFLKVNKYLETNVKGVFGLGDCVGNYMFRHSVNFEGEHLFNTLIKKKKKNPIKYPPMPHAVFSYPEIAAVGKTEDELKKEGEKYIVGMNTYKKSAQGMARKPDHGFVKLLFDKKSRKLLGAHIIGDEASNMIHQLIYAMTFNAKAEDLLNMIYIHPALPEIVRNAVRKAQRMF
ncbi:MAG: dihydrolipoyl dehydrogenase [Candidatus Nanoarchaeia archaeon]